LPESIDIEQSVRAILKPRETDFVKIVTAGRNRNSRLKRTSRKRLKQTSGPQRRRSTGACGKKNLGDSGPAPAPVRAAEERVDLGRDRAPSRPV
jgi:hypothetical protein